jgi:hypothetical protein
MKLFLSKVGAIGILVVFVATSLNSSTPAVEKKKITMTLKSQQILSMTTLNPSDVPKHELGQWVAKHVRTSSDPDWNIQALVYSQWDNVGGNGSHGGYAIYYHPNGDESYVKFEGKASEGTFEGKGTFTGGTGKFKNIKGTISYKGKLVPEFSESFEAEVEY